MGIYTWLLDAIRNPKIRDARLDEEFNKVLVEKAGTTGTIAGTASTATAGSADLVYNQIYISGDSSDVTGVIGRTIANNVAMVTGGTGSTGSKYAQHVFLYKTAASSPSTARDHVALVAHGIMQYGDGGSAPSLANGKGTMFAGGFVVTANSTATNLLEVAGMEMDVGLEAGASTAMRFGASYVATGSVRGSVYDAAYEIGASVDAATGTWNHGILFCSVHGSDPISTTGTCIGTDGDAATVDSIIDFSSYTATSYFLLGPAGAFYVTGAGATTIANTSGANLTLAGNSTPQILFFPSSGATKFAQHYQTGNIWAVADAGVANRLELDLATGATTFLSSTAIPAGGTTGSGIKVSTTSNFGIFFGSGAPTLSAAKGSLYLRSDGSGTTDRAYINTNGSTTWTALTTVA